MERMGYAQEWRNGRALGILWRAGGRAGWR